MKDFKQRAYPFLDIPEDEWEYFASKFEYFEFPKGAILLQPGEIENYLTFLDEALIRSFLTVNDKDLTFRFTFPGSFVSGYPSFIRRIPSVIGVETLSRCKCWRISYKNLQECYEQTANGNKLGRVSAEYLFILSSTREIDMLTRSAEERYLDLLKNKSAWFQHIPLKHLASYLGITPQALSRIRSRIN